MTRRRGQSRLEKAQINETRSPLSSEQRYAMVADVHAVMNKHGWDAVLAYLARWGEGEWEARKEPGRQKVWDNTALMCLWLAVEMMVRRAAPGRCLTAAQALSDYFRQRRVRPLTVAPGATVKTAATAERRYSEAVGLLEQRPDFTQHWQAVADDVERSAEHLGWPDVIMERLHVLSAMRQLNSAKLTRRK